MKYSAYLLLLFLVACGSPPKDDGGMITSSGGEEELSDSAKTVEMDTVIYDLDNQALPIFYFFKLTNEQIGDDYCYVESQVKNLLMGDGPDDFTWISKKVKETYLTFENYECYVTTEFSFLDEGEGTFGILIQSGKGAQDMQIFQWNEGGQIWAEFDDFPKPKNEDFYDGLSPQEKKQVKQFGDFYAEMNDEGREISYNFSTWQMGLNADGKEILDFNREPDFSFDLMYDAEYGFWLQKVYENENLRPKRFFMAYNETGDDSDDFEWFMKDIKKGISNYHVETIYADLVETNYQAIFSTDTFDLSAMEQFEPRNGFWFYEEGKEPLDLEVDESGIIRRQVIKYFGESD